VQTKTLIIVNDYLQVNIGEPALPIQLAGRGKANIVPVDYNLVAGDFHVVNLTPSVTLLTEVKPNLDGNGELPSF